METYSVDRYNGYIIGIEIEHFEGYRKCYATIMENGTVVHDMDGYNPHRLLVAAKQWIDKIEASHG